MRRKKGDIECIIAKSGIDMIPILRKKSPIRVSYMDQTWRPTTTFPGYSHQIHRFRQTFPMKFVLEQKKNGWSDFR